MRHALPMLFAGLWFAASQAQTPQPDIGTDIEAQARALVDAVTGAKEPAGGAVDEAELADWARSVLAEALAASTPETSGPPGPVPARNEPASPANSGEVLVFASLSMPAESWRQWSRQAARLGTPLVLRGVAADGLAATVRRITARRIAAERPGAGAAVDPRLFRLFGIDQVPAVVVVPGGVPPCTSPGCASDAPPPYDVVAGNIGLEAALEAIASDSGPGRDTARNYLQMLEGDPH